MYQNGPGRSSNTEISDDDLADVCGHRVILVFYPADWEPVSQQQLTLYQVHLAEFARHGAVLLLLDEHGIVRWSQTCPAAINPGTGGILTAL